MTYQFDFSGFSIANDVRILAGSARGPELFKAQLRCWADAVEASDYDTWALETLQETCKALVVLAHANAAFSRQTGLPGERVSQRLHIVDRGGYSAAMEIIFAIVDHAPLCNDCRINLMQSVADLILAHKKQLDRLIPLR